MLVYVLAFKVRTGDLIVDLADLRGGERLLDAGTGAGLLLVAAAKRVPAGSAIGIDLWAAKDLSNNAAGIAGRNAAIEGVAERVAVITGDAHVLRPGGRLVVGDDVPTHG